MADTSVRDPLLKLRGIYKSFGAVQALTDVDLDVPAERRAAIRLKYDADRWTFPEEDVAADDRHVGGEDRHTGGRSAL